MLFPFEYSEYTCNFSLKSTIINCIYVKRINIPSTITELKNWNGFVVNDTTNLVVLEAESEGNTGDGKTTCILQQKGDNYANVEQEKEASLKTLKIWHSDGEYTIKYKEGMTWGEWAIIQQI